MALNADQDKSGLHVAIVGGGITGLILALGLQSRGVPFTIYERAPGFREIGAGIGFSPNAERAMTALDPRIREAFKRVATPNGEDYFQWIDGFKTDELVYKLYLGEESFQGCRRSEVLEEWVKLLESPDSVQFNKQLDRIEEKPGGKVSLTFRDGTAAEADAVIGCDGIRSRVRQLLLGEDNPAAYASYTHKFCFRALVPMDKARAAIGDARTKTRFMYNGPHAHAITYPVGMGSVLNVLAVLSDPNPWKSGSEPESSEKAKEATATARLTALGSRSEAASAFTSWHPTLRAVVDLLPEELDKWAIFDMLENPAPSYARGSACVAGDAAHAAGPHLGAGAAFGIEDALVLATVLKAAHSQIQGAKAGGLDTTERADLIAKALQAYNDVRYDRTQWLVRNTRDAAALFQWEHPGCGNDAEAFAREITWRFHQIWEGDVEGMAKEALQKMEAS